MLAAARPGLMIGMLRCTSRNCMPIAAGSDCYREADLVLWRFLLKQSRISSAGALKLQQFSCCKLHCRDDNRISLTYDCFASDNIAQVLCLPDSEYAACSALGASRCICLRGTLLLEMIGTLKPLPATAGVRRRVQARPHRQDLSTGATLCSGEAVAHRQLAAGDSCSGLLTFPELQMPLACNQAAVLSR